MIVKALNSLRPSSGWILDGSDYSKIQWFDEQNEKPTQAEIDSEIARLQAIEDANEYFDKALQLKETDKLLFGKALIAYKSNRELEALEFIQKSNQVNPYNIAISKYLDIWSKKLGNVQSAIRDKNEENEEIEDYSYYMYDAFGYDEEMGMDFDEYLDKFGYS